jgi:hypothetical protein
VDLGVVRPVPGGFFPRASFPVESSIAAESGLSSENVAMQQQTVKKTVFAERK